MGRLGRAFKKLCRKSAFKLQTCSYLPAIHSKSSCRDSRFFKGGQEALLFQGITELSEGILF
jgi:hypothetical protein